MLAVLVLLASGCTGAPAPRPSPPPEGTSIVLAMPQAPTSLNPLDGFAPDGAAKIFSGLLAHQHTSPLRPVLAAAQPRPSPDGRHWTVTLRRGVHFSDGSAFDADDVVATYRALLAKARKSPLRDRYRMITGVSRLDAHTVRFDLAYPYPPFPDLLVLPILPSGAAGHPRPPGTVPAGTGPYQASDWQPGTKLVLTVNPHAMGAKPQITRVTVLFGQTVAQREKAIRDGKIDGTVLPPAAAKQLAGTDSYQLIRQRSAGFAAISLPTGDPVTGDRAVRRALNYAINRQDLVSGALGGTGVVASTPVTDAEPEFLDTSAKFDYDPAKARQILDRAGWVAAAGGARFRHGVRAKMTLDYPEHDPVAKALATAFARDVNAVGIAVTAVPVDPARQGTAARTARLIRAGNPFDPDFSLYPLLHTGGFANHTGYSDAAVDTLLDHARRQPDPAQRAVAYRQLQQAYVHDPALVVLARLDHSYLQRDGWQGQLPVTDGVEAGFTWGLWWNLADWSPS